MKPLGAAAKEHFQRKPPGAWTPEPNRGSDYLMGKWQKLKHRVMYMSEQYEQSGQNANGSMKDPWEFRFLSTGDRKKGRCVLEIVY